MNDNNRNNGSNDTAHKDEVVKKQDKMAQDSQVKAAEANKEASKSHEKQADRQMDKSNT